MRRILFRKVHRMFRCNSLTWQTKTAHVSIAGWQTLSENIRLSSTRQSSRDGLRPFQTVSNHVQTAGNSSKPSKPPQTISILQKEPSNSILLHPVQVQFLGSHRNTFSANCKKKIPGGLSLPYRILNFGCLKFYVANWPTKTALAVTFHVVLMFFSDFAHPANDKYKCYNQIHILAQFWQR